MCDHVIVALLSSLGRVRRATEMEGGHGEATHHQHYHPHNLPLSSSSSPTKFHIENRPNPIISITTTTLLFIFPDQFRYMTIFDPVIKTLVYQYKTT